MTTYYRWLNGNLVMHLQSKLV